MLTNMIRQDRKGYKQILYEQHLERLKNIKSSIDNSEPPKLPLSKKWENNYNRKIDNINNSNRKLVNRLINVRSYLDNKQDKHMKEVVDFKHKMVVHNRKMEMENLCIENILLFDRLKTISPTIKF
jgi:hypothetical protein